MQLDLLGHAMPLLNHVVAFSLIGCLGTLRLASNAHCVVVVQSVVFDRYNFKRT